MTESAQVRPITQRQALATAGRFPGRIVGDGDRPHP